MNEKVTERMGDEEVDKSMSRQLRRPKIIISKCKKPSRQVHKPTTEEFKKVNGELVTENKGKESDASEVEKIKQKDTDCSKSQGKGTPVLIRSVQNRNKRKFPPKTNDDEDDVIVIEPDSSVNEEQRDKSEVKDDSPTVEFKGFKKRILAEQSEKSKDDTDSGEQVKHNSPPETTVDSEKKSLRPRITKAIKSKKKISTGVKKAGKPDGDNTQNDSQAEYAQYLGLQPTMQFKCYRCGEKGFQSMLALNMHQRGCGVSQKPNFLASFQKDTNSDPNMLTNFRITRKVYLCSACGTYYENWNLFLHMRDVHKKHICLLCLAMFGVADKLADHLTVIHNIQGDILNREEFVQIYSGDSFYLVCSICDNLFNERDDYQHNCVRHDPTAKCNLCGVKCGHYFTCPNSSTCPTPRTVPSTTSMSQVLVGKSQPSSLSRLLGPESKGNWRGKKGQGAMSSDNDDDYDISHAASFCHVDIGDETGDKRRSGTEDDPVVISEDEEPKSEEVEKRSPEVTKPAEQKESTNDETTATNEMKPSQSAQNTENIISEKYSPDSMEEDERLNDDISKQITEEISKETPGEIDKQVPEEIPEQTSEETPKQISAEFDTSNEKGNESSNMETDENEERNEECTETNNGHNNLLQDNEDDVSENSNLEAPSKSVDNKDSNNVPEAEHAQDSNENEQTFQKDRKDSVSSSSDDEPVTHLSASHDDSESSSDESLKEKLDETAQKSSVELIKDDSTSSGDSDRSGLVVDEKQKNLNNYTEDKDHNITNLSGDSRQRLESSASHSESTQDTNDIPIENKPVECIGKENGSANAPIEEPQESNPEDIDDGIVLASDDVPAMALTLEDKLEDATLQSVVKECVRTSCLNCVYCSHATKIAVNGKQLALHLLAEHRYKPVKNNETSQDVIKKLKSSLDDLEQLFFNTDSYDSSDKSLNIPYDYTYECFQCRFVTSVHKELYVHKRKMHQKTVLLCVMCKSNFYSYSELLCHMCPGIYVSDDISFRCCFCNIDMIPSAFRLMVHLRKSHHTCDICLEVAGDQQKLSTHMWKHKLNHLCYRCGIAYRNKPDITKHLFWKHGTESVVCKKCLQKKWPHVYHYCIPPTTFNCDECNTKFTKAVALKVHKRFHGGELPYSCTTCDQKFVSKKLLSKHEDTHKEPLQTVNASDENETNSKLNDSTDDHINVESVDEPSIENTTQDDNSKEIIKGKEAASEATPELKIRKKKKRDKDRKDKPVVDVYDLPPLNLSSASDSSDDEDSKIVTPEKGDESLAPVQMDTTEKEENKSKESEKMETSNSDNVSLDENQTPAPVVDGVWDSFHSYKAELEKRENKDLSLPNILPSTSLSETKIQPEPIPEEEQSWFLDHCYCLIPGKPKPTGDEEAPVISEPAPTEESPVKVPEDVPAPRGHSSSIDHAYATLNSTNGEGGLATTPEQPIVEKPPTTPPPSSTTPLDSNSSSKKKMKTPKKKKHTSNSSSSSDSSSDSDTTSSHSCRSNCSCSSSSSGSSSSDSSDSDSSTSEGRRKIAARREKKKEKLKHKHQKEEPSPVTEDPTPQLPPEDEPVVDLPAEPIELPIRESDLDTDESSTDEDFYDKYPQNHVRQQHEKSKLMLLASVAPVNNGTVSPPPTVEQPPPPPPASKRKIKTKKRRKSVNFQTKKNKKRSLLQQTPPSTSVSMPSVTSTPTHLSSNHHNLVGKVASPLRTPGTTFHSDATAGSGSENESARLSKRKRVRNKFYGYSSEEEGHEKPVLKWRKVESAPPPQPPAPGYSYHSPVPAPRPHQPPSSQLRRPKPSESSGTEDEPPVKKEESSSSSSSSESDNEIDTKPAIQKEQTEKSDNLYCYCQCPYDEVSEMIACDGQDCTIEWFHFECVGIMVPPKGKWYCPDCRKRRDMM